MKLLNDKYYAAAFLAAVCSCVAAKASPLVDVQILGSTTQSNSASGYTSTVVASPGQTVYYAVEVQSEPVTSTNGSHTINSITYGTDGVLSLNYNLNLSTSNTSVVAPTGNNTGSFDSDNAVQAPFTDAGSSVYNNGALGTGNLSITGVIGGINTTNGDKPQGVSSSNIPALALVQLGSLVYGNTSPLYVDGQYGSSNASGTFKINNGSALSGNNIVVANGDPNGLYEFDPLDIVAPEPSSLSLLGLGGLAMLRRRRRATAAV